MSIDNGNKQLRIFQSPTFTTHVKDRTMQFHIFQDAKLEWRWQLSGDDGKKVADSGDGYRDKDACLDSISAVKASDEAIVLENVTSLMDTELLSMPGFFRQH